MEEVQQQYLLMVNDLGVGLKRRNIRNFNIESLADNVPVCTAIANDMGYENIFYEQVKEKIKKEDVLIAISCSGNSLKGFKNIISFTNSVKKMPNILKELSNSNYLWLVKDRYKMLDESKLLEI